MLTYLVCTLPRTGSTVLADLLESTDVVGVPREYFIPEFMQGMRKVLNFTDFADYAPALRSLCLKTSGVYSVKLMWDTFAHWHMHSAPTKSPAAFMQQFWPDARIIYLTRGDVIAQAISLYRAEQSNVWHRLQSGQEIRGDASRYGADAAHFDLHKALQCHQRIKEGERQWEDFFCAARLQPHRLQYESLIAEPDRAVRDVLQFLGVSVPTILELTTARLKLADRQSEDWAAQLHAALSQSK